MTTIAPPAILVPAAKRVHRMPGLTVQFVRFLAVGAVSTGLYVGFYLLFRTVSSATVANLISTVLTTLLGTRLNGKVTFGLKGRILVKHHLKNLMVTGLGFAMTSFAVTLVSGEFAEVVVLVLASSAAGALRFVLMRQWVFR